MGFLDDPPPLRFDDPAVRDVWTVLSSTYYTRSPVVDLVSRAGLPLDEVNWDQPLRWVWRDILELAQRQAKLRHLLEVIAGSQDQAVAARLTELLADRPVVSASSSVAEPLEWQRSDPSGDERVLGDGPTFLDIAFLRRGVELSSSVCKLTMRHSDRNYTGTGFAIGPRLLLTNQHNLYDNDHGGQPASSVRAEFGYERTFGGLTADPVVLDCDVGSIRGNSENDWAVIRTEVDLPAGTPLLGLEGAPAPRVDERVYIIQHPGGGPKKIGMIHNVVRYVDAQVVQYLTDTDQGSSGAPVFDEQWRLVALHHRWVSVTVGGRAQFRNQGIRIDRVLGDLRRSGVI
ncbi:MAG TPA: trypsin-like peptidase domain-containing protein [Microlunatus sp.]|nr:trypsin-like peptidase domain-containing protein [Microlunatus sp.]